MKRIIYLCVCLIGFAGLFTSCINQVEPEGLKTLREGKAAYYQALANLQTANSDKIEADAAYEKAMAVADAAYQTAQAALLNAQAGLIDAQAKYVEAQTAAQTEATRHAAEMNKISEEVAKARAQAAEAEAAYWKAYYEDATSLLAAQLKVAMEQAQYQLDSVKAAETALAQQIEEDSLAHVLALQEAQAAIDAAKIVNETAIAEAETALAQTKEALAQAQENLRVTLADIEAQKGLLTANQQGQLDRLMDAYEAASLEYNEAQFELLAEKSKLVKMQQEYADDVASTKDARETALEDYQSDIADRLENIANYTEELASWASANANNELFQGIPISEWLDKLDEFRVKDSVQRIAIANGIAAATEARYEGMKDYIDYSHAFDVSQHNMPSGEPLTRNYFDYRVFTSNADVYYDFDWSDTTANFSHIYNQIYPFMVNRTVVDAYDKATTAKNAAQADVDADAAAITSLKAAKPDTASFGSTLRQKQAAEAAAKAAWENVDLAAIEAQAKLDYPVKDITPLGARSIDMYPFFGRAPFVMPHGYSNNGSVVIAKYMAVMEDAAVSYDYHAATNNLRYPVTYPEEYNPIGVNNADWAASDNELSIYRFWDYEEDLYPYVAVERNSSTDIFAVNTPAGRIQTVFFGGSNKNVNDSIHVTAGIYGILDHIHQDAIYGLFKDNNADNILNRAEWQVVYTLDSLKYATDIKALATLKGQEETSLVNHLVALKGSNVANPDQSEDAYKSSLLGQLDSAKAAYEAAKAKAEDELDSLNHAKKDLKDTTNAYNVWAETGWNRKFVHDFTPAEADYTYGNIAHSFLGGVQYWRNTSADMNQPTYQLYSAERADTLSLLINMANVQLGQAWKNSDGADYTSPLYNALRPYTGKNDYELHNGKYTRIVGVSPKAWKEFYAWIEAQESLYESYSFVTPLPSKHYTTLESAITHTPYPSVFLTKTNSSETVSTTDDGGAVTPWTGYYIAFSKGYSSEDWTTIKNALYTLCNGTNGAGYQIATADASYWTDKLIPQIQKYVDDQQEVYDAAKLDSTAKVDAYKAAIAAVNAESEAYNDELKAYNGKEDAIHPTFLADGEGLPTNYTDAKVAILNQVFTPATRADFAAADYSHSVYEQDAKMPHGNAGYHFAFEGMNPFKTATAVADVKSPYPFIAKVPTAEMYFICLNNQAGDTYEEESTIGDALTGRYGVSTFTSAEPYTYQLNSGNIAYNYMPEVSTDPFLYNRGFVQEYPYFLGDNRAHGIQLQDYNADFHTEYNEEDGWYVLLRDNFQNAVYYKMIYDQQVLDQLDGTIASFKENLVRFRARVDDMYHAFQADSVAGSKAYVADQLAASGKDALKALYDAAVAETKTAKDNYDDAVKKLGSEDDAAAAPEKTAASYWAHMNYWLAKQTADKATLATATANYKAAQKAAYAAAGECWAKWNELVWPQIQIVNDAAFERSRINTLMNVYYEAYNLAEANGNQFLYPVLVYDIPTGTYATEVDQTNNIYDLYDKVKEYVLAHITMYKALVQKEGDAIEADTEAIQKIQALIDEDAANAALEGYYDEAELHIEAQKVIVKNCEDNNNYAQAQYELAKSQLNTFLTNLGKENVK